MDHNEIAAMYRDALATTGIDGLSRLTEEGQFWDKRIYHFASLAQSLPDEAIPWRLRIDVAHALLVDGGHK